MNKLKDIIKENRKKQNLTQRELADKLNISDKQVSKWETGTNYPDITILNSLAIALNISVNELLSVDEFKPKEELNNKTDHNFISKIKTSSIIPISLLIFSIIITGIGIAVQSTSEIGSIVLIVIGILVFITSIAVHLITNISQQNILKNHIRIEPYVRAYYYKNAIYYSIFMFASLGFGLISNQPLIVYNGTMGGNNSSYNPISTITISSFLYILGFILFFFFLFIANNNLIKSELKLKYNKLNKVSFITLIASILLLLILFIFLPLINFSSNIEDFITVLILFFLAACFVSGIIKTVMYLLIEQE